MAKKKSVDTINVDAMYADLAKETGGDVLEDLDNVKYFIDTGNLAINYSCSGKFIGGGIPGGRITEAYGPEASGKSLIGSNVMYGGQMLDAWVNLLDCENASNGEFMKKSSHLNLKRVIRHAPPSLEKAFRTIHVVTRKIREREKALNIGRKPIIFIFDSLTVPPCERELKENNLPMDFSVAEWKKIVGRQEQPGERARVISSEMRKLQAMVAKEDVTVYLINQVRDKIGVMYGCFSGLTKVMLYDGTWMDIEKIVNMQLHVKVMSINPETGEVSAKEVIDWHKNGKLEEGNKFLNVKLKTDLDQSEMNVTPNHVVFVPDHEGGIKKASVSSLRVGEKVVAIGNDGQRTTSVIESITEFDHTRRAGDDQKYDITVEGNHTYIVGGAMVSNSPETTPGGNAVKFYSSLRFRTAAKKKIEHAKLEKFAGINMQVKNIKNRMHHPFVVADDVKLYFEDGIDPVSGVLNCLLQSERVRMKSNGNFEVNEKYLAEGMTEYKFKASKTENRLSVDVLLDCPKLVDAEDRQQVQEYLDSWQGGLIASQSGEYSEKEMTFDAEGEPEEVKQQWPDGDEEE